LVSFAGAVDTVERVKSVGSGEKSRLDPVRLVVFLDTGWEMDLCGRSGMVRGVPVSFADRVRGRGVRCMGRGDTLVTVPRSVSWIK
jgi:hypothetical protein